MQITYRDLLKRLVHADVDQLDQTVTVEIDDEIYPVSDIHITKESETNVLDEGHIVLRIKT